jgi:hypothetical protein
MHDSYYDVTGARRRRSNGGLGGGCARKPVGTHPQLLLVGAGKHPYSRARLGTVGG